MSHSITQTKVMFSGKIAFIAALLIASAFVGQAKADELTPIEQAAVNHHLEILATQQSESESSLIESQLHDFDAELSTAEEQFMDKTCDDNGLQYDSDAEVCYE
ncbi:conserved hypothetical protein [Shewanella sediminis HAW-EB3]|uniref:Orphan protein n=1 Tax=Shewanella sediminis (strain HAW-EB3) TaxID=425104 RepID=A8FQU3_SHESH|nr:hypothetical protein [Shewanella sediminis]ABV35216.1 conserved hypothetical protein [Shewanella sediminis HAW-EB3]